MSFEPLRRYAASLPGATRDIKRWADECYLIGGKKALIARSHALIASKLTRIVRDAALGPQPKSQR